ncbi:MAG: hypothetical protein HPY76_09665 [Anaerolineae bacterium]|nr:hypothetical protein [Anaerolineae bacterium]
MTNWRFLLRVLAKALALFVALNLLYAALDPLPALGKLSGYNWLFPGRPRYPFGETPRQSYNLSLYSVDAMMAAHEVSAAPRQGELRVFLVGDSSVWGTLLRPQETLAGQLNARGLACDDQPVRAFNLGYPTISLTKDLMLLAELRRYQPDLVIWLTTLEAAPVARQLESPLAANNGARLHTLGAETGLALDYPSAPGFWERTIVAQRRELADLARLQVYGVMWAATGIDQDYPASYEPAARDLEADPTFHGYQPPELPSDALLLQAFDLGQRLLGNTPLLVVNEPMLISSGQNSDIRYNFFYPRWAYDRYRQTMQQQAQDAAWDYLDLWDLLPESEFTNSAIHLTPAGESALAEQLAPEILARLCQP